MDRWYAGSGGETGSGAKIKGRVGRRFVADKKLNGRNADVVRDSERAKR